MRWKDCFKAYTQLKQTLCDHSQKTLDLIRVTELRNSANNLIFAKEQREKAKKIHI